MEEKEDLCILYFFVIYIYGFVCMWYSYYDYEFLMSLDLI